METVKSYPMLTINSHDAGAPAICCVSPSGQPQAEQKPKKKQQHVLVEIHAVSNSQAFCKFTNQVKK
jgi:hypothetical protein